MGKNLIFMRKLKVYVHLSILFLSLVSFVPNVGCLLLMIYLNIYEVTTLCWSYVLIQFLHIFSFI